MDLIERQDAINAIIADKIVGSALIIMNALGEGRFALTLNDACDRHIRDIEKLPSAQPEQHWIPVGERLPEEDHWLGGSGKQFSDNVLVSIYNSDDEDEWVDVSQTIDGEWKTELPRHCEIVAWMPLPEPYREES